MRIALAQISSTADRTANLERALAAIDQAAVQGAQLVVFAEIVLDIFFPAERKTAGDPVCAALPLGRAEPVPGPTTELLAAKACEHGIVVVFNLFEVDAEGHTFDSSPVIDADGSLLGVTRMVHITDYEGFHEQDYYHPGDRGAPVYATSAGKIGVAICYDRHYPEYMRALALGGAEVICIPQAGCLGEWPDGLYEAEVQAAAFQNGCFVALCNRVGVEAKLTFAGESFIADPDGRILARAKTLEDHLLVADLDLGQVPRSHAKRLFLRDRRPELYAAWVAPESKNR
jgi:predicted amidohydrolase